MNEVSVAQAEAIREIMRIIVDDDLAKGVSPGDSAVCDHCRQIKPAPGFINYDQYKLCNDCSCEYELARVQGQVHSPEQFMHLDRKDVSNPPQLEPASPLSPKRTRGRVRSRSTVATVEP